jgi:hypothetical protein
LPEVRDVGRRVSTSGNLLAFFTAYFPAVFTWPFSADHLRVIERMQECIESGGLFAFAMPRGSGKTTMARLAGLWAVLTGRSEFVVFIGGTQPRSDDLVDSIRRVILADDLKDLHDDYPEAFFPLRALENSARKQQGQRIGGNQTHCHWGTDKLVFPTIKPVDMPESLRNAGITESPSSGSIITATSLDSNIRGQQHTRQDGSIVRPSLALLDDPQTRESARSAIQSAYRMQLLNGDVLGLAGPGRKIAAFLTCTKIYSGDLADIVLDRQKNPQWRGECVKMVEHWPKEEKLWSQYIDMRADEQRRGAKHAGSRKFYLDNRAAMDDGAVVSWPERRNDDDISGIQHAYNLRADMGEEAFQAEYQNEPSAKCTIEVPMLTPSEVAARVNGRPRGEVPMVREKITAFIDVQGESLWYVVCAWQAGFTGFVVDYGIFPEQGRRHVIAATVPNPLSKVYRGSGEDGRIQSGLEALVTRLLNQDWPVAGGGVARIDCLFVDMGYKASLVQAVKHKCGGVTMMLAKGVGIKAGNRPVSTYHRKPGWRLGHFWFVPSVRGTREFPHICVDVNYWKSFVHSRLATTPGDSGSLTLFGSKPHEHDLFAEHISGSETYVETTGHGRIVQEWKLLQQRPDNHWLDGLVGCAAAASFAGLGSGSTDTVSAKAEPKQKKIRRAVQI